MSTNTVQSDDDPLRQMPDGEREFYKDYHIAVGILFYGLICGISVLIPLYAFACVFGKV